MQETSSTGAGGPQGLVDYALQYAGRGWRVFPLSGKVPFKGTKGFLDATTDQATIEAWWRARPDANIGLATGQGIIVLDVDGPEGLAELKALVALHGPLHGIGRRGWCNLAAGAQQRLYAGRIGLHVVCLLVDHNTGTARVEQRSGGKWRHRRRG